MSQFIQRSFTIGASSFTEDLLLANSVPVVARRNQIAQIGLVGSAAGLFIDVIVSANDVAQNITPSIQNRFPIIPDDYTLVAGMLVGDDLKIRVRETSAGALTLFVGIIINPA